MLSVILFLCIVVFIFIKITIFSIMLIIVFIAIPLTTIYLYKIIKIPSLSSTCCFKMSSLSSSCFIVFHRLRIFILNSSFNILSNPICKFFSPFFVFHISIHHFFGIFSQGYKHHSIFTIILWRNTFFFTYSVFIHNQVTVRIIG